MRYPFSVFLTVIVMFSGCARESDSGVSTKESAYLRELGVLSEGETVFFFASSSRFRQSGNFFTDQRVASYWIDDSDSSKTEKDYAWYSDVSDISVTYNDDWDLSHDITITRHDGTSFHVYVSTDREFARRFFDRLTEQWKKASPDEGQVPTTPST